MGLGSPAHQGARSALMPIKRISSGGPVSPWLIFSLFLAFLFANDEYGGPVSPCIIFPLFGVSFRYDVCVHIMRCLPEISPTLQSIFKYLIEESLKNAELFLPEF